MSNKLVYAMRVTRKMTMEAYDEFTRSECSNKIPNPRSKDWRRWLGDSIYDFSRKPPRQRSGVHGPEDQEQDLRGEFALLSDDFIYFGDEAIAIPDNLLPVVQQTQGHRSYLNDPYVEPFVDWVRAVQRGHNQVVGEPQYEASKPPTADSVCSIGRRDEDSLDKLTDWGRSEWTFAYGSNMKINDLDDDLRSRAKGAQCIVETSAAELPGWRLIWNYHSQSRGCGAANVEQIAGEVEGRQNPVQLRPTGYSTTLIAWLGDQPAPPDRA